MNQLVGRRAIRGNDAAQRAHFSKVPDKRAGINVPNDGNLVAIQIKLRGFRRAPVRRDLRELAHDERFDVRPSRFLVVRVRANVSDVRIRKTNDLPRVTWVGEDFLIARQTCVENDFAAAARDRARSSPVKYAPVFQRENCRSVLNFRQWSLRDS